MRQVEGRWKVELEGTNNIRRTSTFMWGLIAQRGKLNKGLKDSECEDKEVGRAGAGVIYVGGLSAGTVRDQM